VIVLFGKNKVQVFWADTANSGTSNNRQVSSIHVTENGKDKDLLDDKLYREKGTTTVLISRSTGNDLVLKYSKDGGATIFGQEIILSHMIQKITMEFQEEQHAK
jgi:hypothetical protein